MASTLMALAAEHLSLLNSLLRNPDLSLREIARQTYPTMGAVGHYRSYRAWEMLLYRHKESKGHFRVVRQDNLIMDAYAVSDLTISAIENALRSEEPVTIALLNALKGAKALPGPTLLDKLEAEIEHKIAAADKESPNTISRNPNRSYT